MAILTIYSVNIAIKWCQAWQCCKARKILPQIKMFFGTTDIADIAINLFDNVARYCKPGDA